MRKNQEQTEICHKSPARGNFIWAGRKCFLAMIILWLMTFISSCGQHGESAGQSQNIVAVGDQSGVAGKSQRGMVAKGRGFSADMIVTLASGQVLLEGKLFVTSEASRMDWNQGSANLSSIRIEQENREYLFNHDKKLYFVIDLDKDKDISNFINAVNEYEVIEVLGKEKVNGMNCTRKKVRSSIDAMGMKITNELIIWEAEGIDFPIRSEGEEGTVTELKNISKKTPSSKLFRMMEGYSKVSNMMEVIGFR